MVIWWHPRGLPMYSSREFDARRWYGDEWMRHATVCETEADCLRWIKRTDVIKDSRWRDAS